MPSELHDLKLKVGTNSSVLIYPTEYFNTTFEISTVLVFSENIPGIVSQLPNLTLVDPISESIFKNTTVEVAAIKGGRVIISATYVEGNQSQLLPDIFMRVTVYKLAILVLLSDIVGWLYFLAWSISFYPQIYQNYKRKSVRGLSLDFVYLNITGFGVYGIFNIGLYWIDSVQREYLELHPFGVIPVQLNDVVFTIHAFLASAFTLYQCHIYDRGSQVVSKPGKTVLFGIFTVLFVILIVASSAGFAWLTFLTLCSYIKLFITLIKYIPQAYLNWSRKSTSGWCIGNVLLDFSGGFFSVVQMFIIAFNYNDWGSIFGDFTKFGLGLFSICFDILFIVQHYVLYRNHAAYEPIEGATNPIVEPNEDIVTSNQQSHYDSSADTPSSPPLDDTLPAYARSDGDE